jgi:hypothetical protein
MDDKFQNIQRARSRILATALLTLLFIGFVFANYSAYSGFERPHPVWGEWFQFWILGVVFAELALLAVWTTFSSQVFGQRVVFLLASATILVSAWLLGYIEAMPLDVGLNLANAESVYFLGWLPLLLLAMSLPLTVVRFFSSRVLVLQFEATPPRKRVSTRGMMLATTVIAVVLSAVQVPAMGGMEQVALWTTSGGFAGFFFLLGLLIVLPVSLLLLSRRKRFFRWALASVGGVILVTLAVSYCLVFAIRQRAPPVSVVASMATAVTHVSLAGMVTFLLGIRTIRAFGYRLRKLRS